MKYNVLPLLPVDASDLLSLFESSNSSEADLVLIEGFAGAKDQLEEVVDLFVNDKNGYSAFLEFKTRHLKLATKLCANNSALLSDINDLCVEAEWLLEDAVQDSEEYITNQILVLAPLLATGIIHGFLQIHGIALELIDSRDLIKTDEDYIAPQILINKTKTKLASLSARGNKYIMANGVGSSEDNNNTYIKSIPWPELLH